MDILRHGLTIDASSVSELQYKLALENLVAKNFGKVDGVESYFSYTKAKLNKFIELLKPEYILERREELRIYLISQNYALEFICNQNRGPLFIVGGINRDYCETFNQLRTEAGLKIFTPRKIEKPDQVFVHFAFIGAMGPNFKSKAFSSIPFKTVKQNYSEEVQSAATKLVKQLHDIDNGLVIMSGPPGTGKTYLIRSLLSELIGERDAIICSPAIKFLTEANLITMVTERFNRPIIVLEDLGDILTKEAAQTHVEARSNILNLSEGLLSMFMDAIIIMTFNNPIENIDPAVIRPGRCLSNIHIGSLPYEQVCKLLPNMKLEEKSYTLAEVYAKKNDTENS